MIFSLPDIFGITEDDLKEEIRNSPLITDRNQEITSVNNGKYLFYNFNFVTEEDND